MRRLGAKPGLLMTCPHAENQTVTEAKIQGLLIVPLKRLAHVETLQPWRRVQGKVVLQAVKGKRTASKWVIACEAHLVPIGLCPANTITKGDTTFSGAMDQPWAVDVSATCHFGIRQHLRRQLPRSVV